MYVYIFNSTVELFFEVNEASQRVSHVHWPSRLAITTASRRRLSAPSYHLEDFHAWWWCYYATTLRFASLCTPAQLLSRPFRYLREAVSFTRFAHPVSSRLSFIATHGFLNPHFSSHLFPCSWALSYTIFFIRTSRFRPPSRCAFAR